MDDKTAKLMFLLLRSAVCGTHLSDAEISAYNRDMLTDMVSTAKKHDVLHLLVLGLKNNGLLFDENCELENKMLSAVFRYEMFSRELAALENAFNAAQIPFIPLKGSAIRKYYPEPWMRTNCDIDILVHQSDLKRATEYLENLGYKFGGQGSHDVLLISKGGKHIELHYNLIEGDKNNAAISVLDGVWDGARPKNGYQYEMTDEMLYFYHIAHMAKHFENGGCGIRPFIDIWVLNHRVSFNKEDRDRLLLKGGLYTFAKQAELLSEIWFGDGEYTETAKQTEDYILRGGVYGTNANRIAVQQQQKGGRVKYALSKVFVSYDILKFHYPILQKHRFLTPVMEVRRWGKLIFCGHLKRTVKELKFNENISKEEALQT